MKFWIAIHRSLGYDAFSEENSKMGQEIDDLNDEMVEAGVRVFVGGFQPPETASGITLASDGSTDVKPGLYLQGNEFVGGFWVLEVSGADEAIEWGKKAAKACRANVEIRPFH